MVRVCAPVIKICRGGREESAGSLPTALPSDSGRRRKWAVVVGVLAIAIAVIGVAFVVTGKRDEASEPTAVEASCEGQIDEESCRGGADCLWISLDQKCTPSVPEIGATEPSDSSSDSLSDSPMHERPSNWPLEVQSTQPTASPTIRALTNVPTIAPSDSPRYDATVNWDFPLLDAELLHSRPPSRQPSYASRPPHQASGGPSGSPSQIPSRSIGSSSPSQSDSDRPSQPPSLASTGGLSQTPSLTSTGGPSQTPSLPDGGSSNVFVRPSPPPSAPDNSHSTTTATVTRIDASTTLTVSRIDARPPGHPFDSGFEPDPIFDLPFMQAAGATSMKKNKTQLTGPSVIRVPDWIPIAERTHPDAVYYMYYASHGSSEIRLAWSSTIAGEWRLFNRGDAPGRAWGAEGNYTGRRTPGSGVLDLHLGEYGVAWFDDDFGVDGHIASPDVHVDEVIGRTGAGNFVATSKWGLNFNLPEEGGEEGHGPRNVLLSGQYLKTFEIEGQHQGENVTRTLGFVNGGHLWAAPIRTRYGAMATHANADESGGLFSPSWPGDPTPMEHPHSEPGSGEKPYWWTEYEAWTDANPLTGVVKAPELVPPENRYAVREKHQDPRHFAVYHDPVHDRDRVWVFYTCRRDLPESVVLVVLDLSGLSEEDRLDPSKWKRLNDVEHVVLRPETVWEGVADFPYKHSASGAGQGYQLRDPDIFRDRDGRIYLFYCGRGEGAIGVAEVTIDRRRAPSVFHERPSLAMTSPVRGYTCFAGMSRIVAWATKGFVPLVDVEYAVDGARWIAIAREVKNEGYYPWTVPEASSDAVRVRVRASAAYGSDGNDDERPSAVSESFFVALEGGSTLFPVRPHGDVVVLAGSTYGLNWASAGEVPEVDLAYALADGDAEIGWGTPWTTIAAGVPSPGTFHWKVPYINAERVRIRIRGTEGGRPEFVGDPFRIVSVT